MNNLDVEPSPWKPARPWSATFALEWLLIVVIAYFYCGALLLNFDAAKLQQTGEHNESATLPLLAEIGISRYGEIPLWNPYMLTGFPHVGDFVNHFWNPVSTIPILLWGGIDGMKVSIFLTFVLAGLGQWMFGYVTGLRRMFRLWSAILFMLSGGLAMLWRVGWYELLVGAAWFPWCFAFYWRALQSYSFSHVFLSSIAVFMVVSTGGGYYPIYLAVSLAVLTIIGLLRTKPGERLLQLSTAAMVGLCGLGLSAVVLVPYLDGYRYAARDTLPDLVQHFSQPIHYGLMNYVISTPDWFNATILGTAGGWNWFYIGWLPVLGLAFVPLAFRHSYRQRGSILASGILFLVLMMWFANRFPPFKQIYDWIPFLYTFRFPNRLLVIATSPLLILSAHAFEYVYRSSLVAVRNIRLLYGSRKKLGFVPARSLVALLWIFVLVMTTQGVYGINKGFNFADQSLNLKSFAVLQWLKQFDPSLYYVNIGGQLIYWDWTPAAYMLEVPMINFQYNRHLRSQERQRSEASPFIAQAKYQISLPDQPVPENARQLREFGGVLVWYIPDTLPYAFSVDPALIQEYSKLRADQVTAVRAKINGPNRVVVEGTPARAGEVLVVLMSDYPGWKLFIDGQPAPLTPYNGYLGVQMVSGQHSYEFRFLPVQYLVGATISVLTLVLMTVMALIPGFQAARFRVRKYSWA